METVHDFVAENKPEKKESKSPKKESKTPKTKTPPQQTEIKSLFSALNGKARIFVNHFGARVSYSVSISQKVDGEYINYYIDVKFAEGITPTATREIIIEDAYLYPYVNSIDIVKFALCITKWRDSN